MNPDPITAQLAADRSLVVVRAAAIPDAAQLCAALVEGGIRTVELTFTSPDLLPSLRRASAVPSGAVLGAGTVLTADDARAAIDAGARFLVTPGIRPDVARVATEAGVPVYLGAMTPTEVAQATGVEIEVTAASRSAPASMDPALRAVIADSARELGLGYQLMPSGAGHDAQILATVAPAGMIFVPSIGGVSHVPEEDTAPEDLISGARVLLRAAMRVAHAT